MSHFVAQFRRATPASTDQDRTPLTRIAWEAGSLYTTVPHSGSGRSSCNLHQRHSKRWPSRCHFRTVLSLSSPFYRPGSSRPTPAFFNELATLLEQFALYNTQVLFVGDLNLHLEDPSRLETSEFETILRQFGMAQHVAESTHRAGGWLDVIGTRDDTSPVVLEVFPPTISDHGLTTVTLPFLRVGPVRGIRHARAWRDLDRDAFSAALRTSLAPDEAMASMTVTELFAFYERATDDLISTFLP